MCDRPEMALPPAEPPFRQRAVNEQEAIAQVVGSIQAFRAETELKLAVCVIDDGSTDNTATVARNAGADRVISHGSNRGCGAAVRSGLVYGRDQGADIVVKMDGDGPHDPADISELLRPILEDRADVVYGNRFPRMGYRMPLLRRVGNSCFRSLMRWLTHWDIDDSQPGSFAVNASYLRVSFIPGDYNYTQQVLLDAYLKGMRFAQVPVSFKKRESGSSFVSFKYPFVALHQIIAYGLD